MRAGEQNARVCLGKCLRNEVRSLEGFVGLTLPNPTKCLDLEVDETLSS